MKIINSIEEMQQTARSLKREGKTIAFVAGKLMSEDGTLLATATANARLVETAKAVR